MNETVTTYRVLLQRDCKEYMLNLRAKAGEQLEQIVLNSKRESTNDYAEIFRQCLMLVKAYSDDVKGEQLI